MVKINWKGKRIVGKADNGTNRKNNNRFKKEKRKKEKGGKNENVTELQKPSVEAEVYNNNKKCD